MGVKSNKRKPLSSPFRDGSGSEGEITIKVVPFYNPPRKQPVYTLKEKNRKFKGLLRENIFLSGFPIEDLGNDGGGKFPPAFRKWRKEVTVR